MAHYLFTLDGYNFPDTEEPALGPFVYLQPRKYSVMTPIGSGAVDADIITYLGLGSQKWDLVSRASSATKDKLLAVYNAGIAVVFKTPQDTTGINVLMTKLEIAYASSPAYTKYLCNFQLTRRA